MVSNLPDYIIISKNLSNDLSASISDLKPDKIVVLVDENTKHHCLPLLDIGKKEIIEIESGEKNKILSTCSDIWKNLTDLGCSRKSLLINLGGGVIGDMGGFCASTFKRGMPFINIPTTLLSQVDASIGGKLGVDFNGLKNHIGLFKEPDKVIIDAHFLSTLPQRQLKSGFAEIIKHALIYDSTHWESLKKTPFNQINWNDFIQKSVEIKNSVVEKDPNERGLRKILNFGHSLGHAIESHLLNTINPLLHGEAVAVGMILESNISYQKEMINKIDLNEIEQFILSGFELPTQLPVFDELSSYLMQDKKNENGIMKFSLLQNIGECLYDINVSKSEINTAIDSFNR
ncbi:MAG: 3-dehydroquinate synthase [Ekhidna sp.]